MTPSVPPQFLKWSVSALLAVLVLGGMALIHFGLVRGYAINCVKARQISCVLQRDTSSGLQSQQVSLGNNAAATVQVKTYHRGRPRVFLYLNTTTQSLFAAEFEGGDEVAEAQAAAARLNEVFSSAMPASVRLEVRPAAHMRPIIWGGFGFFVLLVLVIYRELIKP